jgi:hypothetical protein
MLSIKRKFQFKFFMAIFFLLSFNWLLASDSTRVEKMQFIFPHSFGKLFIIPTAEVINSLDVNLNLGGGVGFEDKQAVLGSAGVGLGGVGQVDMNGTALLGSIGVSDLSGISLNLKVQVLKQTKPLPAVAIGFHSTSDWQSRGSSLVTYEASPELYSEGVRGVDYKMRQATLYAVFSKNARFNTTVHFGVGYTDMRLKDTYTRIISEGGERTNMSDKIQKERLFNIFGGVEYPYNERTWFLFEVQKVPYIDVDLKNNKLLARQRWISGAGIRFALSKIILVESSLRYEEGNEGIADLELRLGINLFFSVKP